MQLQVGDLCHWNDGNWDVLCIYRGPSFSEGYYWFDFFLCSKPTYVHSRFHSIELTSVHVIGHIDGVVPVAWGKDQHGNLVKNNP